MPGSGYITAAFEALDKRRLPINSHGCISESLNEKVVLSGL
jgi:hypothetical protein